MWGQETDQLFKASTKSAPQFNVKIIKNSSEQTQNMNLGNTNADVPRSPQRLFLQDKASENAWPNEQQRRNIARPDQPTTHLWRYGTNRVPLQSQSNQRTPYNQHLNQKNQHQGYRGWPWNQQKGQTPAPSWRNTSPLDTKPITNNLGQLGIRNKDNVQVPGTFERFSGSGTNQSPLSPSDILLLQSKEAENQWPNTVLSTNIPQTGQTGQSYRNRNPYDENTNLPQLQSTATHGLYTVNNCFLPIDSGRCRGTITRYAYLKSLNQCVAFIWTGCEGNGNRFEDKNSCQQACVV